MLWPPQVVNQNIYQWTVVLPWPSQPQVPLVFWVSGHHDERGLQDGAVGSLV